MLKKLLLALVLSVLAVFTFPKQANAQVITITSTDGNSVSGAYDQPTKILRHSSSTLDPAWNTFNYNDSSWGQAYSVWSDAWWHELSWIPSGQPPGPFGHPAGLAVCAWCFINRSSSAQVIQATPDVVQGAMTRDFFRKKFTLPAGKTVKKAYLYANSDNLSKYWLNGGGVFASNTSLDNYGDCSGPHADGIEGFIYVQDVTSLVQPGDNLLTGNNLNTAICNQTHPMGVQFFLWIELEEVKGDVSGYIFQDFANTCDPNSSGNQPVFDQAVNLFLGGIQKYNGGSTHTSAHYSITGIDQGTYDLISYAPALGKTTYCEGGHTSTQTLTFSSDTHSFNRDIAFVPNLSWLNVFDGDVYGQNKISVNIPTQDPNLTENWLINKTVAAGGTAISHDTISTRQLILLPNHSSVRSFPHDLTPPGWEVVSHPPLNYLSTFKFQSSTATLFPDWNSLQPNRSYSRAAWVAPLNGVYRLTSDGVTTLWFNNSIKISDNLKSFSSKQGLVIVVDGTITIDDKVDEIDAVLIGRNSSFPGNVNPDGLLTIKGGLYTLGDINPARVYNDSTNQTRPAITVRFQPVYLLNTNPDFVKYHYFWQELTPG